MHAERLVGDDKTDTRLLRDMNEDAKRFILSFQWSVEVRQSYFGCGIGGIIAAFLVQIAPAEQNVDEWLWIVVGDVPPAYLVTDSNPTPSTAIKTYVELMSEWVWAVESDLSVSGLIPVNAPATKETAAMLKKRLQTIEQFGLY